MSRHYEFDITIAGYRQRRAKRIRKAVEAIGFGPDAAEPFDWETWQDGAMQVTGRRSLCGGQSEGEFADEVAIAAWRANRGPCRIEVRATYLEELPYGTHSRDATDYHAWKEEKKHNMKPSDSDGSIPVGDEQEPHDDAKCEAVALVVVSGGVAGVCEPPHVDVRIVDLDNIKAGDPPVDLPAGIGFEELARKAGLDDKAVRFTKAG